jgi:hypothetical protein
MGKEFLRTYQRFDIAEVQGHLLIMGDLTADCASCRALGINVYEATTCPQCGTTFRYLTSRRLESHTGERFHFAHRMQDKRPDLILIDYDDYTKTLGRKKARDFLGG